MTRDINARSSAELDTYTHHMITHRAATRQMLIRSMLVLAFVTGAAAESRAQWLGSFSLDNGFSTNAFGLSSGGAASITGLSAAFGWFPDDASWSAQYSGMFAVVPQYTDQQYSMHALSFAWDLPSDSTSSFLLSLSSGVTGRFGQATSSMYDYWQGAVKSELRWEITGALSARASYYTRYRSYTNLTALSSFEHMPTLGASLMLETNTSVHAEVFAGQKLFTSAGITPPAGATTTFQSGTTGLQIEGNGPGGGGKGGGNGNGNGGSGGGLHAGGTATAPVLMFDATSLLQGGARLTIGQSLAENIGLSLRYQRRWNLSGEMRAVVAGVLSSTSDDELIDDPYSYSGDEYSATITAMLPWSLTLRTTGYAHLKSYPYAASLDETIGGPDRSDRRFGAGLTLEKTFDGAWLLFHEPVLTLGYQYVRNQSNSPSFDYNAHAISIGLELGW